ncbi:hypothetical protein LCGC14_0430200 [marine sediment metagenome]|uniref:Uncharacterized protein n=1 Tax=marine sediment metagenome TaxID=412755 RepID=A0A0F9SUM1_9ZZZZ
MFSEKEVELLKLGLDALLAINIKGGIFKLEDAERLTALALYQKLKDAS